MNKKSQQNILFYGLIFFLASCGGGGGTTPPPPDPDVKPPLVIATAPRSTQIDVLQNTIIKITFSEKIVFETSMIEIQPYIQNSISQTLLILEPGKPYEFDDKLNTLSVFLKNGELQTQNKYRVTIHDVQDTSKNKMGSCQWDFYTVNYAGIKDTTLSGLCGAQGKPSKLRDVVAAAGDGLVLLTWNKPTYGTVDYYTIDVSYDNKNSFSFVNSGVPAIDISYLDVGLNDTPHVYRLTAINSVGEGVITFSNTVTPLLGTLLQKPLQILQSNRPGSNNIFGGALDFSFDGKTLAVGEFRGDTATTTDVGKVQLFIKSGGFWIPDSNVPELTSSSNLLTSGTKFGISVAFSPISNSLAVSEPLGNGGAGAVHFFTKNVGSDWTPGQILTAPTPVAGNSFSTAIAFSPDGNTFAVGESKANLLNAPSAGQVQLFKISSTTGNWIPDVILKPNTQTFSGTGFGYNLAFSPDSQTIAIGDFSGSIAPLGVMSFQNNNIQAVSQLGEVHLYTKGTSSWKRGPILTPLTTVAGNWFGEHFIFSPGGNTLAVSGANNGVQLFTQNGTSWGNVPDRGQVLFGSSTSFSPNGNNLALLKNGIVQLFAKISNVWSERQVLKTQNTANDIFNGATSIIFTPDGKTIAIGENFGNVGNGTQVGPGVAQIFTEITLN